MKKEDLTEWQQHPVTKWVKEQFHKRLLELSHPLSSQVTNKSCEAIALQCMRNAGRIEGIQEVLNYEGD